MKLRYYNNDDYKTLLIFLPERLDNLNIPEIEKAIFEIIESNDFEKIIIEASELNYISSIGIRLLIKLAKKEKNLEVVRVTPDIMNLFTRVGLDTIIPIFSSDKVIYAKGLKVIYETEKFTIYELEKGKALKVVKNNNERNNAINEKNFLKRAFLLGVPTLVPYDYVRTLNGKYGVVYEMPKATSFETLLNEGKDENNLVSEFVENLKAIHSIEVPESIKLYKPYKTSLKILEENEIINNEEKEKLIEFYKKLAPKKGFLHNDLDFRNIIKTKDGENLFIHITGFVAGHPIYDFANLYSNYYLFPEGNLEKYNSIFKLEPSKAKKLIKEVLKSYYELNDEELEKLLKLLRIISIIRYLNDISLISESNAIKLKNEVFKILEDNDINLAFEYINK